MKHDVMKQMFDTASVIKVLCDNGQDLLWLDDPGIGFLPSNGMDYGDDYWENYQKYATSSNANAINEARRDIVTRNLPEGSSLCDVGIGNGQFVTSMKCDGFDVNLKAVEWLEAQGCLGDPVMTAYDALSFWDVLEHIEDPSSLLTKKHVFTSLPIHRDLDSLLKSKHLKPNEHLWHFTLDGFIAFMNLYNYNVVEVNDSEIRAGREGIWSFYFKRRSE